MVSSVVLTPFLSCALVLIAVGGEAPSHSFLSLQEPLCVMLPICVCLSLQKTDIWWRIPLKTVNHIAYIFCPLKPWNFYTSSPEGSSAHTPKPGGPCTPLNGSVYYSSSVFPRGPLGVPLRKRGEVAGIISEDRTSLQGRLFLRVSFPCMKHRVEQREGRKVLGDSRVEPQLLKLPFQGAS